MTAISIAPTALLGRERRIELETTGDADVLLRVMVVLRRRGFAVRAVEFRAGDQHAPPRLHMTVASASARPHQLSAWLRNVVGVVDVTLD
jgi:acetolactate synthase regulatory subunit